MTIAITGIETASKVLGKAVVKTKLTIAEGLTECSEKILNKALGYVPVDTGALKESGRVETKGTGKGAESKVIFGGTEKTYYALYVHENLQAFHLPPTCAKFLEKAARQMAGTCQSIVAAKLGGRSKAAAEAAGEPGKTGYTLSTNVNHATKYLTGSGENVAYQTYSNKKK